jgi:hypothetical protein
MYYILYLEYIRGMTQVSLNPKVTADSLCACYNYELYLEVS